jgi:hypothetical protein
MKRVFWIIGGICAATAGIILYQKNRNPNVEELAHRLEDAWADNHTAA